MTPDSIASKSNTSDTAQLLSVAPAGPPAESTASQQTCTPEIAMPVPERTLRSSSSPLLRLVNSPGLCRESEPAYDSQEKHPAALYPSRSTPGLSLQLTQRITTNLLHNPTVIHRPKLCSRPAILTSEQVQGYADTAEHTQSQGRMSGAASASSQPSSLLNSSNPPARQSTAPTSPGSADPKSTDAAQRLQEPVHATTGSCSPQDSITENFTGQWLVFPRQNAPRLSKPSVVTVENVAAAKIFFESHFNCILGTKISPRSIRQRNMERKLFAMALPNEQLHRRRQEWFVAESNHLRHIRVLKSKSIFRQRAKAVHIANYEIVRVLGKGSFGVVRLVREKSDALGTACRLSNGSPDYVSNVDGNSEIDALRGSSQRPPKQVYAMKVIRKSDMLRNSQEGHLRAERDFLVASENSRWVVPLIASFQDRNNLYLVMEYMVGGDFLGLLLREDLLDENVAKWYVAEMILCIEEAHRMNWIHRDVKPDNFLITSSGHLKISDFGLAFDGHWSHTQTYYNQHRYSILRDLDLHVPGDTQDCEEERERLESRKAFDLINGKMSTFERLETRQDGASGPILDWLNRTQRRHFAKSVVGTSQYMAPEVIRGENYDGRCDWWSIGIILYEVDASQ